ncbi:type VI secretion system protein TssA [Candidatus Poribacteria bacterium]|nr:type VI secretion system protein TssA [Candidatus Poribacteria bacterium]
MCYDRGQSQSAWEWDVAMVRITNDSFPRKISPCRVEGTINEVKKRMSALIEEIRKPITETAPCGGDVQYDSDFQVLQAEVDKLSKPNLKSEDGTTQKVDEVNWPKIIELSRVILAQKSKNMRVAGYLCLGLLRREGFTGLAEGLEGYQLLLREYWDGLYPPLSKINARKINLENQDQQLARFAEVQKTEAADGEALQKISEIIEGLNREVSGKLPQTPPILVNLAQVITTRQREVDKPQPKPAPPKSPAGEKTIPEKKAPVEEAPRADAKPSQQPVQPSPPQREPSLSPDTWKTTSDGVDFVIKIADVLRRKELRDIMAYRLSRVARWDLLQKEPHDKNGKTVFNSPSKGVQSRLSDLILGQEWETLVTKCEEAFVQGENYLWLDLQRYLSTAFSELGPNYETVHRAIVLEMGFFVNRVPKIAHLSYADGTPFADALTQEWIERTVRPAISGGKASEKAEKATTSGAEASSSEAQRDGASSQQITAAYEAAKTLFMKGDLAGALSHLQEGIDHDATRKGRFLRRLHLAGLCLVAKRPEMSRPILEDLDAEIERFALDQWEPGLCMEVWKNLRDCYQAFSLEQPRRQGGTAAAADPYHEKADKIFEKICRYDIRFAMK